MAQHVTFTPPILSHYQAIRMPRAEVMISLATAEESLVDSTAHVGFGEIGQITHTFYSHRHTPSVLALRTASPFST
jgi:hypothetical protein